MQGGSREFVDSDFPRDKMITNATSPFNRTSANLSKWITQAEWVESIDLRYPEEDGYGLWGNQGINPNDIF